jgi:2-dehydropantoate 2-reductase
VLLIHHNSRVVEKIRREGLTVREPSGKIVRRQVSIKQSISEEDDPDIGILTVKTYDTDKAARIQLKAMRHVPVITLQNGLGNVETLQRYLPSRFVLAGSTTEAAMTIAGGPVYHTGRGTTRIGELTGRVTARCLSIQKAFVESGFRTLVSRDILAVLWLKAIVNSAVNPISALGGVSNRQLLEAADLWHACVDVVREGIQVMSC